MDAVDHVRIIVVVDNHIDMLLTSTEGVKRFGLFENFIPPHGEPICTENGISFWIEAHYNGNRQHVLFDTSLTSHVLLHNLRALGLSSDLLSFVVISHGHPDHFGGLLGVLGGRQRPVNVAIHPDAFLPKYIINDERETILTVNHALDRMAIQEAGGILIESREPSEIIPGVLVTGEIPRRTPFEPPVPIRTGPGGVFVERDGELVSDEAPVDDQAVVVNVRRKGLIVLTACGHSGVINTITYAQELSGVERIHAVMGGFHTGFPDVPPEATDKTIAALKEINPSVVAPMHCAGLRALALTLTECPDQFLENVVGTTFRA